jgi:hypothetical protein
MRVESTTTTRPVSPESLSSTSTPPPTRSVSTLSSLSPSALRLSAFAQDLVGFFINLIFFPLLGHHILLQQTLILIFLPILLPFVLIGVFIQALIDLLTCDCLKKTFCGKFQVPPLTEKNRAILTPFVEKYGTARLFQTKQVFLLHILKSYMDYTSSLRKGFPNYRKFQAVLKIQVDGKTLLLPYKSFHNPEALYKKTLEFLGEHGNYSSEIKCTFVGVNYSYLFGLLDMRATRDGVEYHLSDFTPTEATTYMGQAWQWISGAGAPSIKEEVTTHNSFGFWPGFTRDATSYFINAQLRGDDLSPYQISLLDDELVKL